MRYLAFNIWISESTLNALCIFVVFCPWEHSLELRIDCCLCWLQGRPAQQLVMLCTVFYAITLLSQARTFGCLHVVNTIVCEAFLKCSEGVLREAWRCPECISNKPVYVVGDIPVYCPTVVLHRDVFVAAFFLVIRREVLTTDLHCCFESAINLPLL